MNMQRAVFALSLTTLCLVIALLFVELCRQPQYSRDALPLQTSSPAVVSSPAHPIRPPQNPPLSTSPSPSVQTPGHHELSPGGTTRQPPKAPPENQTGPPIAPPVQQSDRGCIWTSCRVRGFQRRRNNHRAGFLWRDDVPYRKRINFDADPHCAALHTNPVYAEDVIINTNNTLRNVFVYVKQGLEGLTFNSSQSPVTLDQRGCLYQPHVLGIMVHQPLVIVNSDDTLHNIHVLATVNKDFNVGQPNAGMQTVRSFAKPEVMIKVKCDVHPWMSGYIGVLDHPFYSVTGDDGTFQIRGLPAGTYLIEAWHEVYGTQTQTLTVTEQQVAEATFSFGK